MPSQSYRDLKRYLEVTNRLIKSDEKYLITDKALFIPSPIVSPFDDLAVDKLSLERAEDNNIYGISHKDGNIYVQSIRKLRASQRQETADSYLFSKDLFVDIKKIIPNPDEGKFIHLHNHLEFSLSDGLATAEDYARRCKQLGMPAIAVTDHGNMAGAIEFYKACKKYGIKPILGEEFYFDNNRFEKGPPADDSNKKGKKEGIKAYEKEYRMNLKRHLILWAKNDTGLHNLYKLSSYAYLEGFYYKPRIDWELLEKYHDGIICSTACAAGIIGAEDEEKYRIENLRKLVDIFGKDNLYLELMLIQYKEQPRINDIIIEMSNKYKIPLSLTVDAHYVDPDIYHLQHIYMKIGSGFTYGEGDNCLKTYSELKKTFKDYYSSCKYGWEFYENAITNNFHIAEQCNVEIELGCFKLPKFDLQSAKGYKEGDTILSYFKRRIMQGWKEKIENIILPDKIDEYKKRLLHEIKTIIDAGYTEYILIVLDVRDYLDSQKIINLVRGSAAGSLVCYLLDMTKLDPIEWDLIFERFISPLRAGLINKNYQSPADIDLDSASRPMCLEYIINKYGKDNVARIGTYNRFQIKQALKQISDVTGFMDKKTVNILAKKIKKANDFEQAMDIPEFKDWYGIEKNKIWFDKFVEPILDLAGGGSIHAAGVVITPEPIMNYMPVKLQEKKKEEEYDEEDIKTRLIQTQYEGDSIEAIGLLKFDELHVRTLCRLQKTREILYQRTGKWIDYRKIDLKNPRWYEPFRKGDTTAIFQFDTQASMSLVQRVKPNNFKELMDAVALVRPGTAGPGLDIEYCLRKNEGKTFEYDHPLLEPVLKDSFGICIYQETLMQMSSVAGGLTLFEADELRKVMKKKDHAKMASFREKFITGALERGCKDRTEAEGIWGKITSWSRYGFSKNHAGSYAQEAVWCMAMKIIRPIEFYLGCLYFPKDKNYLSVLYRDIIKHGIKVCLPDINRSKKDFTYEQDEIIWSLSASKNIGDESAEIISKFQPYSSFDDFINKHKENKEINKRVIDALISIDAFHSIYSHPKDAAVNYYNYRNEELPLKFSTRDIGVWDNYFYQHMGFHNKDFYEIYGEKLKKYGKIDTYEQFCNLNCSDDAKVIGYINFYKKIQSKRGEMCIIRIESDGEEISIVAWSSFYSNHVIKDMGEDDILGRAILIFGQKNLDPQGDDQIQLSGGEDRLEFL